MSEDGKCIEKLCLGRVGGACKVKLGGGFEELGEFAEKGIGLELMEVLFVLGD